MISDGKTETSRHIAKDGYVKIKISVILPVHNAEKELVSLVNDCFETTGDIQADCEIVIIDDASTDASGEIAENLSLEFPQIKVISQWDALGTEKSILNGLRLAEGSLLYIYYLMSGYMFPQITLYYEAMPFTDVVLGRFLGQTENYVGMAMLKSQTLPVLGNAVANPEEAVLLMNRNNVRYLELRYEARGNRNAPSAHEATIKPGKSRRASKSVVPAF